MDNPQPSDPALTSIGTIATWALTGAIGAGLSSLRKHVTMRQAALHVMLSSFICSCAPYAVLAFWPTAKWYVGVPISMAIGLTIFGISIMLEKADKKIEDVDIVKAVQDKLHPPGGDSNP